MILSLFIFFELVMIGFFITAFFTQQEILWGISVILSGVLMLISYSIQIPNYVFDSSVGAYTFELTIYSFPYLVGFNAIFFALGGLLAVFDIFDKYGISSKVFTRK